MAWQTPKTDYNSLYIPGPGDFNRIEGNEQWLKDEIAKDGLFVLPSDTVILQANVERERHVTEEAKIVKKFWLKHAGIYRVYFELYSDAGMTPCIVSSAFFSVNAPSVNSWRTYNVDIFLPPGQLEIVLSGRYDEEWGGRAVIENPKRPIERHFINT